MDVNRNISHMSSVGDPQLLDNIVRDLKSQGIFDQFRRDCLADVDTKPSYQNLRQRVEGYVSKFLSRQNWNPTLNKNSLRDLLRRQINETEMLSMGVEHVVDQIVTLKANRVFLPQIEMAMRKYLGLEETTTKSENEQEESENEEKAMEPTIHPQIEIQYLPPESTNIIPPEPKTESIQAEPIKKEPEVVESTKISMDDSDESCEMNSNQNEPDPPPPGVEAVEIPTLFKMHTSFEDTIRNEDTRSSCNTDTLVINEFQPPSNEVSKDGTSAEQTNESSQEKTTDIKIETPKKVEEPESELAAVIKEISLDTPKKEEIKYEKPPPKTSSESIKKHKEEPKKSHSSTNSSSKSSSSKTSDKKRSDSKSSSSKSSNKSKVSSKSDSGSSKDKSESSSKDKSGSRRSSDSTKSSDKSKSSSSSHKISQKHSSSSKSSSTSSKSSHSKSSSSETKHKKTEVQSKSDKTKSSNSKQVHTYSKGDQDKSKSTSSSTKSKSSSKPLSSTDSKHMSSKSSDKFNKPQQTKSSSSCEKKNVEKKPEEKKIEEKQPQEPEKEPTIVHKDEESMDKDSKMAKENFLKELCIVRPKDLPDANRPTTPIMEKKEFTFETPETPTEKRCAQEKRSFSEVESSETEDDFLRSLAKFKKAEEPEEDDGQKSDVTVSSVHTSDLSSFDDEISLSSNDESTKSPVKETPKKLEAKEKIKSPKQTKDKTNSSDGNTPISTPATPMAEDIDEETNQSAVLSIPKKPKQDPCLIDNPTDDGMRAGSRRQRKINPKYASDEYSSIFNQIHRRERKSVDEIKPLKRKYSRRSSKGDTDGTDPKQGKFTPEDDNSGSSSGKPGRLTRRSASQASPDSGKR